MQLKRESNTALIFINQLSQKVTKTKYENPETEYGGKALIFKASIRVRMSPAERVPRETDQPLIATKFKPKTIKNKTAQPGRTCEMVIRNNMGTPWVDKVPEIMALGKEFLIFTDRNGVALSGGSTWFLNGKELGSTKDTTARLYSDAALRNEAIALIREHIALLNKRPALQSLGLDIETGEIEPDDEEDAPMAYEPELEPEY